MREPRTVLIAHPGSELYGSDRVMLETAAALTARGVRVVATVPTAGPLEAALRAAGAQVARLDIPVLRKSLLRPAGLARLLLSSIRALPAMHGLIRALSPDVVYVSTLTIPLWTLVARLHRVRVVAHVHEAEREAAPLLREALATPLRLADRVLVNSTFSRRCLLQVAPGLAPRSRVLVNGVAGPVRFSAPRTALDGCLRVVYIGRLSERKGVDVAVEAVALLSESGIDAQLDLVGGVFAGYEWYAEALRGLVAERGLQDRVRFLGFQDDIWASLAAADVAVVPSRLDEPFGNTAVEAVLAARPVVVSAIGGLSEAIGDFACAIPVGPDDAMALAGALMRIVEHWDRYRGHAVTDAVEAARRYSPARYRKDVAKELLAFPRRLRAAPEAVVR